jgi:hypothetical protein
LLKFRKPAAAVAVDWIYSPVGALVFEPTFDAKIAS